MGKFQFPTTRVGTHSAGQVGANDGATAGAQFGVEIPRHMDGVTCVRVAVSGPTLIAIFLLTAGANGDRISIFGSGHGYCGQVFLLLRLVIRIDLAVALDDHLVIRAGRDVDRSEIDIDDDLTAGRTVESLTNSFFR